MKKIFCCLLSLLPMAVVLCQTESFDIIHYTPPKDWKKEIKQGLVLYTNVNTTTGGFCAIALYASAASSGDAEKDFQSDWKDLVLTSYKGESNPKTETEISAEGWKVIGGASPVQLDSVQFYAVLTVYSGFGKKVSVVTTLNDKAYLTDVDALLQNIKLDKTVSISNPSIQPVKNNADNSIVGTWSNSSVSIGNYVSPSGAFLASADVSTMEEYTFKANNTYVVKFFGSMQGKLYYSETSGTYKISGRNLTLTPSKRKGGYTGDIHDEKSLMGKPSTFDCYVGANKWEAGPFLNLHKDGNYYMYSDYPYDYYKKISDSNKIETGDSPDKNKTPMNQTADLQTNQSSGSTGKFGHLIYKPIDGWKQTNYTNAVSFTPPDILPGYNLETRIMESKSFSGSLTQAFAESWSDALTQLQAPTVIKPYTILAEKKSHNEWEYIRGEGIIADNGNNEFYINLFVVKLNNRIERMFTVSQRIAHMYGDRASAWENYSAVVDDFFYSVKFDDWMAPDIEKGDLNAGGIVGVYGKRELLPYVEAGISKMGESGVYYIFFSNGQVYQFGGFPRDGLEGLNTWAAAVQDTFHWSTYSFQNGKGAFKIHGAEYSLKMIGTGVAISRSPGSGGDKYPYPKISSVDGAVFNGTYTIESVYHDDKLDGNIIFTADGKFIDNGPLNILNHRQTDSYNITEKPGSGTYQVKNYTVIFKYTDGRILHIAFPGINYDKKNQSPGKIMLSFKEDTLIKK